MAKEPPATTDALGRPLDPIEPSVERPYDASDPVAVNNRRKEEGARRRRDADVLRKLMHTREGRDWLYRFLELCHIYGTAADLGGAERNADPLITYFRLGEENIGKQLMLEAQRASADLYLTMLREQNEKKERRGE